MKQFSILWFVIYKSKYTTKRYLITTLLTYSNSYPWKVHYTVCLFQDIRNKSRSMGHYENKYHNHRSPGIRSITFAYLRRKNKIWQHVGDWYKDHINLPSKKSYIFLIFTSFSILWPANPPPPCLLTLVILRLLLTERWIVVVECTSMLLHLSRLCSVKKSYHLMLDFASKIWIYSYTM